MGVKERILDFISNKNISVSEFEKRCSLSNGYISSMRKGFGIEKLENVLKKFPDLNRDWLLYGEGEMLKTALVEKVVPKEPEKQDINMDETQLLRDMIANLQQSIDLLTKTNDNLQKDKESQQKDKESQQKIIEMLQKQIDRMQTQIEDLQRKNESLQETAKQQRTVGVA